MSKEAQQVIDYIARGDANKARGGQSVQVWPYTDGLTYGEAETILDIYHDLVKNKGFELPNNLENFRAITREIRNIMGYPGPEKEGLKPTLVLDTLVKKVDTGIGPDLYEWVFPKRIKYEPPKPVISDTISKGLTDIKWIVIFGVVGYVIFSTGAFRKIL